MFVKKKLWSGVANKSGGTPWPGERDFQSVAGRERKRCLRGKGKQVTFHGKLFVPLLRAAFFLYLPASLSLSSGSARPIGHVCGEPRKTRDADRGKYTLLGHVMQLNRPPPAHYVIMHGFFLLLRDWICAPCAEQGISATAAEEPQLHYRAIFFCSGDCCACDAVFARASSGKSTHTALVGELLMTQIGVAIGRLRISCTDRKDRRKVPNDFNCEIFGTAHSAAGKGRWNLNATSQFRNRELTIGGSKVAFLETK